VLAVECVFTIGWRVFDAQEYKFEQTGLEERRGERGEGNEDAKRAATKNGTMRAAVSGEF
jgi:hypothetical protein